MFCWTFWPNTSPVSPHQEVLQGILYKSQNKKEGFFFWANTSPVSPHQTAFDTSADTVRETLGRIFAAHRGNKKRFSSSYRVTQKISVNILWLKLVYPYFEIWNKWF